MSSTRIRRFVGALVGAVVATFLVAVLPSSPAAAHGNVTGPASRNYGCFERWGSKFQDPAMATVDPMCWQAWQADPNAMWNWNGLFREGVAGNHQAAIPDGQLCSAGHTQSGRYNALDAVGNWTATPVGNSFDVRLFDGALHGADYVRVYVTKPSFNPVTQALTWSDLDLVSQIGNTPAAQWAPVTGGVQVDLPVRLTGRTGRAMVYTIWQASHLDQSYYFCSDVDFGGGGSTPPPSTPPPSTPPPSTPPPSTPPPSTPPATTPPATTPPPSSGACTAAYSTSSQWSGGYRGDVTVTAGPAAIKGWTVTLTYASAPAVQQAWNATVTTSGGTVTATNVSYNGALGAGAGTSFGFLGSGTAATPAVACRATL
jgi:lytic cellulose monooxygenase (C4-dehydrogenating)